MSDIQPGWYKDPADPSTQRYWDGEGWLGEALPADVDPPAGPPPASPLPVPAPPTTSTTGAGPRGTAPGVDLPGAYPPGPEQTGTYQPGGAYPGPYQPGGAYPGPGQPGIDQPGPVGPVPPGPIPPGYYPTPVGLMRIPTRPPAGFVLASGGARFAARLVDMAAVLLLCSVANAVFAYRFWQVLYPYYQQVLAIDPASGEPVPQAPDSASYLVLAILAITTAVWFAYEVPSSANTGQTLGKRLVGIRVMRMESDERLGFGRSLRRWSRLGLPTLFWSCCGIGLVLQFVDCLFIAFDRPLHQALHDKAAATVVVRVPRRRGDSGPDRVTVGGNDGRTDARQP